MTYSILTEARIKGSVADLQPEERGYSVYWTENGDLEGWDTTLNLDVVGVWNSFLFGTKRTANTGSIGPSNPFVPIDARVNSKIFFRLKYDKHPKNKSATSLGKIQFTTASDPVFNDEKSVNFEVIPDGRWKFYEVNMGEVSSWVGEVNSVRFFPCINGAVNDEFFLNFFEIGSNDFTFSFENPKAGVAAQIVGDLSLDTALTITQNVNDRLVVNIDGYGDVQITLTPQAALPKIIARDISLQLGKVGIGGYIRSEAFIEEDTNKMIIESGIRAVDSSVVVKDGPQSVGFTLGFLSNVGTAIGTSIAGADPNQGYVPLSAYRPTTLEIIALFDNDSILPAFSLDPQSYVVEGGRRDFGTTNRRLSAVVVVEGGANSFQGQKITTEGVFDGGAKTLIDINHPFSDDGTLDRIFINGVADTGGATKWKIFRPNLNGTITLVIEGVIGKSPTFGTNEVLTADPGVYSTDLSGLNIKVRRGDLLGLFNADLHVSSFGVAKVDALYYSISGDVTGTVTPPTPSGAGESGLPMYARSLAKKNKAVVDIDFRKRLNLDKVQIFGTEDIRDLEYNIAIASSASFIVDLEGSHTVCYNVTVDNRICFPRVTEAFNKDALNDDVVFAENGVAGFGSPGQGGSGGADADGATYFYVNGDGEFMGSQEFVGQNAQPYDFNRDPLGIDCFFSASTPRTDKPIGKVVIYFKDKKNQRTWQIETAQERGSTGSKAGFSLIPESSISRVVIDNKRIEIPKGFITTKSSSDAGNILLRNPVILDVVAADGTVNPQQGVDFTRSVAELGGVNFREQATFLNFQWNRFEWNFDAIRTTAFRWYNSFHWSTKISEFQVFAVSTSFESLGDNTQVLLSSNGENFITADLLRSDANDAEYKLGASPQFMRLIFRPTLQLNLNDVRFEFEDDQICLGEEGRLQGALTIEDARIGTTGIATTLEVTNSTNKTADLVLDIAPDISSSKQLLYFNKLNKEEDILLPQVGPPGRLDLVPDKILEEQENIAINARCWGLLSLVSGTANNFITDNQLINPGFESGDLTGWDLVVVRSGIAETVAGSTFQVPRVMNIDSGIDEDTAQDIFQSGDFVFGFSMDKDIRSQDENFTQIEFELSQTIDVSEFAEQIDTGQTFCNLSFKYIRFYGGTDPTVSILGAPTSAGARAAADTLVSPSYGTNTLRAGFSLQDSSNIITQSSETLDSFTARLKSDTRFVRIVLEINATNRKINIPNDLERQKFISDDYELTLELPNPTSAKWYKSWRTGVIPTTSGDQFEGWTDSSFNEVTEFVAVTGSTHWYQPYEFDNATGLPSVTQFIGFSTAFSNDRFKGCQSFRRMTMTDPGELAAQWSGEKEIVGFRIMMHSEIQALANVDLASSWPHTIIADVLSTKDELGGIDPDINNNDHFKTVKIFTKIDPLSEPTTVNGSLSDTDGPWSKITTWLFDGAPVRTEGLRVRFTVCCDKFERDEYPPNGSPDFGNVDFALATGCPSDNSFSFFAWNSDLGIGAGFFTPLESVGNSDLPIDNVIEHNIGSGNHPSGNMYIAVDLGRRHNISIEEDLFELIASTPSQNEFNVGSALFSKDDTSDPNQVVWAGNSADARWIRFISTGVSEFEKLDSLVNSDASSSELYVESIPQSTVSQARVYPDLLTTLGPGPTSGYNSSWKDLGITVADNKTVTNIFYSDHPIIAIDLGRRYIINNDSTIFRKRHDLVGLTVAGGTGDLNYWIPDTEDNWTYGDSWSDRPEVVVYRNFGDGVPDTRVRWVAVKGAFPLLISAATQIPKSYNFKTSGQVLFYMTISPRTPQIFTENAQWFSTEKTSLVDVSTFKFALGAPISVANGVDFGSAAGSRGDSIPTGANNIGDPFLAFDGKFDELGAVLDVWGVETRDIITGLDNVDDAFPHSIWRIFRDTQTEVVSTKVIKAIKIRGYNEQFYPTTFSFQFLEEDSSGNIKDPNLNSSWTDIEGATFSSINTFQDGFGFTHIFVDAVETKGMRVRITASVYPDDSVESDIDTIDGTGNINSTFPQTSSPQTRVVEVIMYEEQTEAASAPGTIETNHMASASVSSNTFTPDHGTDKLKDGDISSFWQSTGFSDTITITLPGERPITHLEWELDSALGASTAGGSTGAPLDFSLTGTVNGVEQVLVAGSDVVSATFSGTLAGAPVTAKDFKFNITDVQGRGEDANSILISELRLIEVSERTEPLVVISDVPLRRPGGTNRRVTKITYASDSDEITRVSGDGWDGNNDALWSQRDFFSLWVHVNDITLLDTTFGNIKLGNDPQTYYRWDISGMNLVSGWNELNLQFRTADDTSPIVFQPGFQFNSDVGDSQVDFITPDIEVTTSVDGSFSNRVLQAPGVRFFELEFRGSRGAASLEILLDDFRFIRNKFEDKCKFNSGLYLNNSELFTVFLEGLDIATGTVEFYIQPDWDQGGRLAADRPIIPAIFRIMRPDGKFLSLFYRPNQGFIPMIYDGTQLFQFVTNINLYKFERFETFHVALVWNADGGVSGPQGENASLALYINGEAVFGTSETWNSIREGGASVIFGGEVGQRFAATPDNSTALLFTAVPTQPARNTASVWGLLENIKMYNYAKSDFSDINSADLERTQLITPAELIEISTDGITFSKVGVPLTVENVAPGESATIYVRTIIPKGLTSDVSRDASLLVRWKVPLEDCD